MGREKYDMTITFSLDMDCVAGLGVRSACNMDGMEGRTEFEIECVGLLC